MDEQLAFVKHIVQRLTSAGIEYMMTGSMAMAVYASYSVATYARSWPPVLHWIGRISRSGLSTWASVDC